MDAFGDFMAKKFTQDSSDNNGIANGTQIAAPIHLPVNVCGNTVNIIGLLNPAFGNVCINH